MKKVIILAVVLVVILGVVFVAVNIFTKKQPAPSGPVTISYWGLWEEENLVKPVIAEFERKNPNIKVSFTKQTSQNYRPRVQSQIQEGNGPDVFRIHNSWLPMFDGYLSPAPEDVLSMEEFKSTFYPIASDSFVKNNQIFASPMEIDGLALYYNEELLKAANLSVPRTWKDFIDASILLTAADPKTGQITQAGAALGLTANVDHWSDIVGLLLMQEPGVNLPSVSSANAANVLRFYTNFAINSNVKKRVWDKNMPGSTQAFAQGRVAFYFAPSWRAHELRVINPSLNFKVAPVPQLGGSNKQIGWATFWGEAVSSRSKFPKESWQFVKFLTSAESQRAQYTEASKIRLFGEPYSRIDLASQINQDPIVGAFVAQGPIYKHWYLSSNTQDLGLNDNIIKYFEDGINAITNSNADPQSVLQTVDAGVKQVLSNPNSAPAGQNR
jgi:multiple sugar transport system substrate-binding protein